MLVCEVTQCVQIFVEQLHAFSLTNQTCVGFYYCYHPPMMLPKRGGVDWSRNVKWKKGIYNSSDSKSMSIFVLLMYSMVFKVVSKIYFMIF